MPLGSGLQLWAYVNTSGSIQRVNYSDQVEELTFTTIAPGGYGDLTAKIKAKDARNVPPELRMFSRVAVMDPFNPNSVGGDVFLGRWVEPGSALDATSGDLYNLSAQGAGHCLKDDPSDTSYTSVTAMSMLASEFSAASAYLLLDTDQTYVLPDQPASTITQAFNGQTLEDKLNTVSPLIGTNTQSGDYQWCVWGHPKNKDFAGFPTWTLYWHIRNSTTASYTAYDMDLASTDARPSVEWSYNVIQVKYLDVATNTPASVTVSDTRLGAGGAQGNAPFPRRKLIQDLSGTHLSSNEALGLANALLNQYQNGGFKLTVVADQIRDANGNLIPLHQVRADTCIFLPELSPISSSLSFTPTQGQNLFYIVETSYTESSGQAPQLTITCNSFYDTATFQIARLQYKEQLRSQNQKTGTTVRKSGEPLIGQCGTAWGAGALANDQFEMGVNYGVTLSAVPSSITLSAISTSNAKNPGTTASTVQGFSMTVQATANGAGFYRAKFTANP